MQSDRPRYVQPGFSMSGKDWQLDARGSPESIKFPSNFPGREKDLPRKNVLALVIPCLEVWKVASLFAASS